MVREQEEGKRVQPEQTVTHQLKQSTVYDPLLFQCEGKCNPKEEREERMKQNGQMKREISAKKKKERVGNKDEMGKVEEGRNG